jgi:NitT/TauT family transport system ATP-binding protein
MVLFHARGEVRTGAYVELRNISKTFSGRKTKVHALDDVSLDILAQEFMVLVGPSGCGKSTLLRIIGGLISHDKGGQVHINGELINPKKMPDYGIIFQVPILLPWLTVMDNILYPLRITGKHIPPRDHQNIAHGLVTLTGLAGFENSYPWELSGGMQQRVALCRSLILDPPLLVMDEPFGALDLLTRERMTYELQKIWLERRKTVLFVTHSVEEAAFLGDRVAVMSERPGRIIDVLDIDIPRPRSFSTKRNTRFIELMERLRELLGVADQDAGSEYEAGKTMRSK